jgi:hypothetical protein
MNELWNYSQSAAYCGLPINYFRNIVKGGTGPNFVKPIPRKIMFRRQDLDGWISTWVDRSGEPSGHKPPPAKPVESSRWATPNTVLRQTRTNND